MRCGSGAKTSVQAQHTHATANDDALACGTNIDNIIQSEDFGHCHLYSNRSWALLVAYLVRSAVSLCRYATSSVAMLHMCVWLHMVLPLASTQNRVPLLCGSTHAFHTAFMSLKSRPMCLIQIRASIMLDLELPASANSVSICSARQ